MFYLLIIISIIGYSLQGTLIVSFSRKVDPLSLAVYRNVSLVFTMMPLLFLSSTWEPSIIYDYKFSILLTGISGTIGLAIMFKSVRYLPVGISSGFRQASGVLASIMLALFFFQESFSIIQTIAVFILLCGVIILSKSHHPMPHLDSNALFGLVFSLASGVFIAIAFFMMGKLAREISPAISGYLLEASIGICSVFMIAIRRLVTGKGIESISLLTFLKIALVSSPTVIGTGAAAWAISIGPFCVMRAYSAAGLLVTVLLSHLIYAEHLKLTQWIGIVITIVGVVGLRLG